MLKLLLHVRGIQELRTVVAWTIVQPYFMYGQPITYRLSGLHPTLIRPPEKYRVSLGVSMESAQYIY